MSWWDKYYYFGFYPIHIWSMNIHCDNCGYEGKGGVDKFYYGFFILATLALLSILSFYVYVTLQVGSYPKSTWFRRSSSGFLIATIYYLYYFFRPQKYHCPKCHAKEGTPLSFHKILYP